MRAMLDDVLNRAACEPRGFQCIAVRRRFNRVADEAVTSGCVSAARAAQAGRAAPFKCVEMHGA
eukprot:9397775-Lingulodinium_polyedra.AAC.1